MFSLPNIVSKQLRRCLPWDFQQTETISDEVRYTLTARQAFYRNPKTDHSFYSFIEGASDAQRVTQDKGENPPRAIYAFVADYDLKLTEAEILAGIEKMGSRKPTWYETSLGGKFRLVWLFESPLRCLNAAFAVAALKYLLDWLPTNKLPGLDEPAAIDPTRLYCNGCVWRNLGHPPISADEIQGIFVEVARGFAYRGAEAGPEIPFDVVYTALLEKFPGLRWPSEFVLNSQGPSFWVPGSTSPMSAIVKETGLITFAAHADHSFYNWRELLGKEFVEKYELTSLGNATRDIYYDGTQYWRKLPSGIWMGETHEEIRSHLKIDCGLSAKSAGPSEPSQLDRALQHVRNFSRIEGAAPVVFRPPGVLIVEGRQTLNTWHSNVVQPSSGTKTWADAPFLHTWLQRLWQTKEQFDWLTSWMAYAYQNVLAQNPMPGQALFVSGGVGTGKSLFSRYCFGGLLGGFGDAASYATGADNFNSELFSAGVWCVDDETVSGDERGRRKFAAVVKKTIANSDFRHNKKYAAACKVEWVGRLIVTMNADQASSRTLIDPEMSMLDKVAFIRAADSYDDFHFPSRTEILKLLAGELPVLGRILADWQIPTELCGDKRFGLKPFHHPSMMEQATQTSASSMFGELVEDWRAIYFSGTKDKQWTGTATQLIRDIGSDPRYEKIIHRYTPEGVSRMLLSLRAQSCPWLIQLNGGSRAWKILKNHIKDDATPVLD